MLLSLEKPLVLTKQELMISYPLAMFAPEYIEKVKDEYIRLKAIEQAAKDFLINFPYYADLMDSKTEIDFKNLKELLQID